MALEHNCTHLMHFKFLFNQTKDSILFEIGGKVDVEKLVLGKLLCLVVSQGRLNSTISPHLFAVFYSGLAV